MQLPLPARPALLGAAMALPLAAAFGANPEREENWPRFRGPGGSGVAASPAPLQWSRTENMKWIAELPGPGSSSPVVWGDRVFVTCYTGYGDGASEDATTADLVRHLLCFDLADGGVLWTASEPAAAPEDPYEGFLPEHGYASSTPATDGERIYCFYGKSGVFAYDFEGKRLWSAPTGDLSSGNVWGSASSVVLHGDAVIVQAGDEARALLAYHKETGEPLWRMDSPQLEQTYNTPVLQPLGPDRTDLIVAMRDEILGLDPATGAVRWFSRSEVGGNLSGSPLVLDDGLVAVFSGFPRTLGAAFRGGGEGDRSDTAPLWHSTEAKSYMPVPVLHEGLLYWVAENGIAHCARPGTGEVVYRERLDTASPEGRGMPFYASPVLVDGHLVAVSRTAGAFVIPARPEFELARVNRIEGDDTRFQGTPAVSQGHLLLRSEAALYAIAEASP